MKNEMGGKVVYYEADDAIHDYIGIDWRGTAANENVG